MKQIKNNIKLLKVILLFVFIFIQSCECGFSERCHEEKERTKFLKLSPEEQKKKRDECMQWVPISCYTYSQPTKAELERLNKK
jgi:hypothetical protein